MVDICPLDLDQTVFFNVLKNAHSMQEHEEEVGEVARRLGFTHVSLSSEVMPMVRIVPRGFTASADAYLTPCIKTYLGRYIWSLFFVNSELNVYRAELEEKLMKLREKGINSLAVVLMHSYMNKVNIKIILRPKLKNLSRGLNLRRSSNIVGST